MALRPIAALVAAGAVALITFLATLGHNWLPAVSTGRQYSAAHRQDLRANRIRCVAITLRRLVGQTASEQVRAVDSMTFRDGRHPPVPEGRIPGQAV
jgi:hypothetical protein